MKLNIKFEELVPAFQKSSAGKHYFIDAWNSELICIDENIEKDAEEKLQRLQDKRYVRIPALEPGDETVLMEVFIYKIEEETDDFDLIERLHMALESGNPLGEFGGLLQNYPGLKERWTTYMDNETRNRIVNWLCENNIKLVNQQWIPKIEVNELKKDEIELPDEFEDFGPAACVKCHNKKGIQGRFFVVNHPAENELVERETRRIMKKRFGIGSYGCISGGKQEKWLRRTSVLRTHSWRHSPRPPRMEF